MSGLASHTIMGVSTGMLYAALTQIFGPDFVVTVIFGGIGGSCRWLANRASPLSHEIPWKRDLWGVPLGALFALGLSAIAAPAVLLFADIDNPAQWIEVFQSEDAKRGTSCALGFFATEIINFITKRLGGRG